MPAAVVDERSSRTLEGTRIEGDLVLAYPPLRREGEVACDALRDLEGAGRKA